MKTCLDCPTDLTGSHGNRQRCEPCRVRREVTAGARTRKYHADYYQTKTREERHLRIFGLTLEQFHQKIVDQGGLCALCRKRPANTIDHDHLTGAIRGILCGNCNKGIGLLGDDAHGAHSALHYLVPHGGAVLEGL